MNCITINTDASFHPIHQVGGYAFYIVCDLFKIQKAGQFKEEPKTAEHAEVMCIGNAIATLLAQKELPAARFLIINNDCKYGMNNIKKQGGVYKQVRDLRNELIQRMKVSVFQFRYVKAHNGSPDARSWVNEWCDREAKKMMRKSVKQKLKNQSA